MRRWRILAWADRPERTRDVEFNCTRCEMDSKLPVNAADLIIAQMHDGLVADSMPSRNMMPDVIQCPHCRRRMERAT